MQIKFDFNNMMESSIGEQGITEKEIESVLDKAQDSYAYFEKNRGNGWMGWAELPYNQEEVVRDIIYTAAEVRAHYENFVVLVIDISVFERGYIVLAKAYYRFIFND